MKDLKWFVDREMDTIIMVTPDNKEVDSYIKNKKEAEYYFDLQEKGFTFRVKLRVHKAPPVACASCEG